MKHYRDKWLLGGSGGMAPPRPQIVLSKQIGPEQWDIWKFATNTEELVTWTGYFTETSHGSSHYSFHYNHTYFIQACVPLPFVVAVRNLQFHKTLRFITCINCKLYTCLNSSMSTKNESLLILRSQHNLWLPIDLQRPWKEGPMARLASWLLLIKLLWWSKWFIGWLILGTLGLIAIFTTAALQTSIQTHNVIQNWTKVAHTMWTTQAQIKEEVQDKIQEIKIAFQLVRDQLIDL